MVWRDGAHLLGTPIWCDARRRRDVCFASSADQVGRAGHGQLIGTQLTLALIGADGHGHLAVPLRQRFTLGTLRLELIPSGRGFGAAALHVDLAGRTVLYAGAVRTAHGGVGDAGEVRTCDAVVVAAPLGELHHKLPPLVDEIDATVAWARRQLASARRPVLLVDSVLDGLEVAARLAADGIAIAGPRALRDAAQRIAPLVPRPQLVDGAIAIGQTIAPHARAPRRAAAPAWLPPDDLTAGVPVIASPGKEPRAVVWLDAERDRATRQLAAWPTAAARVSGHAAAGHAGYDAGFAWASAADRRQLLGWIEATGARDVFVTGACADAIVGALGKRAHRLGPPQQMALFPREAAL